MDMGMSCEGVETHEVDCWRGCEAVIDFDIRLESWLKKRKWTV